MPKLHQRIPVLDGRAAVVSYERQPTVWYYRETAAPGEYKSRKIEGVTTADEAVSKALDIYTEIRTTEKLGTAAGIKVNRTSRVKRASITISISEHLREQSRRADAGLVTEQYVKNHTYHLRHMAEYLSTKHIEYVIDIKDDTFDDYQMFRNKATKIYLSNELKAINLWLNWCRKKRQLKADVAALKLTPKVAIKGEDLLANPPISPEDWKVIEKYIRTVYVGQAKNRDRRGDYWRRCFYAFVMTGKHTGMRPKEILNLRWSDVSIVDMGQRSKGDERRHLVAEISVRKTKTGEPRQVPGNCGKQLKEWLEYQQWFAGEYFGKSISKVFNSDSYVFCNFNSNCNAYCLDLFQKTLRSIYRKLDLKGHWSSDKPYTLYSLRSSYINDRLMDNIPVATIAIASGHDIKTLMRYYQQLDVLRKSRELTKLPVGKRKDGKQQIQMW